MPQDTTSLILLSNETLHDIARRLDIDSLACLSLTCQVLRSILSEQLATRCSVIIHEHRSDPGNLSQSSITQSDDIPQQAQGTAALYHQWDSYTGLGSDTFCPVNKATMSIITLNSIYLFKEFSRGETRDAIMKHLRFSARSLVTSLMFSHQIPMIRYLIRECDIPWLTIATEHCPEDEIVRVFTMLIQDIQLPINECNERGQTALHIAVRDGGLVKTSILLNLGANDRQVNDYGLTPLHLAVLRGYRDIARLLLARYDKTDICEWPQCFPTKTVFSTIVHRFVKDGSTPLHVAACAGNVDDVSLFSKYTANFLARDDKRKTCLWYAAINRHLKTVQKLVVERAWGTLPDEREALAQAKEANWKPPPKPVTYWNLSE